MYTTEGDGEASYCNFSLCHLSTENSEPFVRVGTPQDQALTLAMDMLISVLNACIERLMKPQEDDCHHGNSIGLCATLRQFISTVKVWFDWLTSHQDLWQASSIR